MSMSRLYDVSTVVLFESVGWSPRIDSLNERGESAVLETAGNAFCLGNCGYKIKYGVFGYTLFFMVSMALIFMRVVLASMVLHR